MKHTYRSDELTGRFWTAKVLLCGGPWVKVRQGSMASFMFHWVEGRRQVNRCAHSLSSDVVKKQKCVPDLQSLHIYVTCISIICFVFWGIFRMKLVCIQNTYCILNQDQPFVLIGRPFLSLIIQTITVPSKVRSQTRSVRHPNQSHCLSLREEFLHLPAPCSHLDCTLLC